MRVLYISSLEMLNASAMNVVIISSFTLRAIVLSLHGYVKIKVRNFIKYWGHANKHKHIIHRHNIEREKNSFPFQKTNQLLGTY
jgi:hypothetical protein